MTQLLPPWKAEAYSGEYLPVICLRRLRQRVAQR